MWKEISASTEYAEEGRPASPSAKGGGDAGSTERAPCACSPVANFHYEHAKQNKSIATEATKMKNDPGHFCRCNNVDDVLL